MPSNGEYDLIVENTLSTAFGGPFGDPSWSYVGVIEVVEAPAPQDWDFQNESLMASPFDLTSSTSRATSPKAAPPH